MKSKDIKTGVVYGFRLGKYGTIVPIVFLAPADAAHIYAAKRHTGKGETIYAHSPRSTKPQAAKGWTDGTYGWAAVGLYEHDADHACLLAATLDGFLAATASTDADRGISYKIVTSPTHILGPYKDVVAADQAEAAARNERFERESAERKATADRAMSLVKALGEGGVKARFDGGGILIGVSEFEALAALVRSFTEEG